MSSCIAAGIPASNSRPPRTACGKVGSALDKARGEFDTAYKRLSSGRGNLVGRVEKLRQLGIKTKKSLPSELLDDDDDPNLAEAEEPQRLSVLPNAD